MKTYNKTFLPETITYRQTKGFRLSLSREETQNLVEFFTRTLNEKNQPKTQF